MEVKIKDGLWKNGEFSGLKNLKKVTKRFSIRTPNTSIKNINYETSKEGRANKLEFEHKRSYALAESQRTCSRIV